jgi:hypothetical protein
MLTFLEFYETLLKFTLFKLYHGLDLAYPPVRTIRVCDFLFFPPSFPPFLLLLFFVHVVFFLEFYETLPKFTLFDGKLEECGVYMAAVHGLP